MPFPNLKKLRLSKKSLLALLLAAAGLLLLFAGRTVSQKKAADPVPNEDLDAYRESLREEIEGLCRRVKGVGNVTVAVTLDGGFSSLYAKEYSASGNESYVKIGSGSSASGLLLERRPPGILGIGVVCEGGASAGVVAELSSLLAATYKIPLTRIHISPAK